MIIVNNPLPLSQKEEFIADRIVSKLDCPDGHRYHSYFGVGWNSTGMQTQTFASESGTLIFTLIFTWHRWPMNGLDNFPSEVPTEEVADILIRRELVSRFIRDAKNLLIDLYFDAKVGEFSLIDAEVGEFSLICGTEIPWSNNKKRQWDIATDFAVTLLANNDLTAIKEYIL